MKNISLLFLLLPFGANSSFNSLQLYTGNAVEIRSGEWPIMLHRTITQTDTTYSLQFRDVQVLNGLVMDTLPFSDATQLKYLEKALAALKTGNNGDIAKFKDYSVTRADKKREGTWYILKIKWGLTDFRQSEADLLINTIRGLKF